MAVLDKRICEALSYADEVVDVKKDETIEGIVSVKKHINTLGPVKTVVVSDLNQRSVRHKTSRGLFYGRASRVFLDTANRWFLGVSSFRVFVNPWLYISKTCTTLLRILSCGRIIEQLSVV